MPLSVKEKSLCNWIQLYHSDILECSRLGTWLAIKMAGQHIQLKLDHPTGSNEWALYYYAPSLTKSRKEDETKKEIFRLVKKFLQEGYDG